MEIRYVTNRPVQPDILLYIIVRDTFKALSSPGNRQLIGTTLTFVATRDAEKRYNALQLGDITKPEGRKEIGGETYSATPLNTTAAAA